MTTDTANPQPVRYRVIHETVYSYARPVALCYNEAHLLPRSGGSQKCLRSNLLVDPAPIDFRERLDFFGNRVSYFSIDQPHSTLVVTATSEVEVSSGAPCLSTAPEAQRPWEEVRDAVAAASTEVALDARQFVLDSGLVRRAESLARYASPSFTPGRPLGEVLQDLMTRMGGDFTFDPESTEVATPLLEVLSYRRGVCQDFAHLAVAFLRSHGLAARYVSGYLETAPPPGTEKLRGADASHAWVSTFVPDLGWVDFDPTNDVFPGGRHITTGWGRDYSDVTPLKGVLFGDSGEHLLRVSVDVEPLDATPTPA